jgi:hypothetical protein
VARANFDQTAGRILEEQARRLDRVIERDLPLSQQGRIRAIIQLP